MRDCRWTDFTRDPFIKAWMDTHANWIPSTVKHKVAVSKSCYWGSHSAITVSVLSGWSLVMVGSVEDPKTHPVLTPCPLLSEVGGARRSYLRPGLPIMKCSGFQPLNALDLGSLPLFFFPNTKCPCSLPAAQPPGTVNFSSRDTMQAHFSLGPMEVGKGEAMLMDLWCSCTFQIRDREEIF